jgi:hypothetical protein
VCIDEGKMERIYIDEATDTCQSMKTSGRTPLFLFHRRDVGMTTTVCECMSTRSEPLHDGYNILRRNLIAFRSENAWLGRGNASSRHTSYPFLVFNPFSETPKKDSCCPYVLCGLGTW